MSVSSLQNTHHIFAIWTRTFNKLKFYLSRILYIYVFSASSLKRLLLSIQLLFKRNFLCLSSVYLNKDFFIDPSSTQQGIVQSILLLANKGYSSLFQLLFKQRLSPLFSLSSRDCLASESELIYLPYLQKTTSNEFPVFYLETCYMYLPSCLGLTFLHQSKLL